MPFRQSFSPITYFFLFLGREVRTTEKLLAFVPTERVQGYVAPRDCMAG